MKLFKLLLTGILFLAFACTESLVEEPEPVLSGVDNLKSGVNNPLEFQTNFNTYIDYRGPFYLVDDGWAFEQLMIGTGVAKHMGKIQMLKQQTVSGPMSMERPFMADATTKYVSANKDTLCFHTWGGLWPDQDLVTAAFQAEFLYATGRFAKATGGEIIRIGSTWDDDLQVGTCEEIVIIYF